MKQKRRWPLIIIRLAIFAIYVLMFLIRGFYIHWTEKDPNKRKKKFASLECWTQGICCKTFGVEVTAINEPPRNAPGLFVGNHLGFLDILAVGGLRPLLFVTSQEMRETPFLGLLTEMAGCIYVERRNRSGIQNELQSLIDTLKAGHNVCLFPEATSHNGEQVLPFKRTLITSAAHAQVPIYPYTFNFTEVDGEPFSMENRDFVCWYGTMPFMTALLSAFSMKTVKAEILFHPPVHTSLEMDRGQVADNLHARVASDFVTISPA